MKSEEYVYFINLDERSEFQADVRYLGRTVFVIDGFEIFEDGFMRHKHDVESLRDYLAILGVIRECDTLRAAGIDD